MLAIRLPEAIEKRLEKLARRTGRTKTYYVRQAILEYIEDLEDAYLAEEVLERVRLGKERTYSLDEVIRNLGLDEKEMVNRAGRNRPKAARKTR